MRRSTKACSLLLAGLLMAGSSSAFAEDVKWYDAIAIGGHVQGSYVAALNKDVPQTNQLRVYDANNGFNLNQAQIRIAKPMGDDNYGFGIKLLAGNDAESIHSTGLGTATDAFDLQEAYVNMGIGGIKGLTFTGGKFVTTAGVEVIESPLNMTIEPGLLFFYGMPFTHTGLKANYALSDKISVMGGVVNGWDQVQDINAGKTIIAQVATTLLPGFTANMTASYGPELLAANNKSDRTFFDFVLGYTGISKLTLNAEALWGQDSNTAGVEDSATTPWSGFGLWASYAVSDWINPGARFEVFKDQHNAARLGGANQTAKNFTLVNKMITSKATFVRLQYRHDWSNEASYTRGDGSAVTTQNTISADWVRKKRKEPSKNEKNIKKIKRKRIEN
jgi:hypothetical protein